MNFYKMVSEATNMTVDAIHSICESKNRLVIDVAIDDNKKLSYFTGQKLEKVGISSLYITPEIRQKHGIMCKPGKLINYLFGDKISPKEVKNLTQLFLKDESLRLELWDNENIKEAYLDKNYSSVKGSLGNSCMRYKSCQEYLDFYSNYDVKILVLLNQYDEIMGRALIWENVYNNIGDNFVFMDRIYTCNENHESMFKDYAIKHGYAYKKRQSYDYRLNVIYKDKVYDYCEMSIIGSGYFNDNSYFPYLDTFLYCSDSMELSNKDGQYCLNDTSGRYETNGINVNGVWYSEDEVVYSEVYGDYILLDEAIDIDGMWYDISDSNIINVDGEYYHIDDGDIVFSEYHCEWMHCNDAYYSEYENDYFKDNEVFWCDIQEDYFLNEDKVYSSLHDCYITSCLAEYSKIQGYYYYDEVEIYVFKDLHTGELVDVFEYNLSVIDYNKNICSIDDIVIVGGKIFSHETYQDWRN